MISNCGFQFFLIFLESPNSPHFARYNVIALSPCIILMSKFVTFISGEKLSTYGNLSVIAAFLFVLASYHSLAGGWGQRSDWPIRTTWLSSKRCAKSLIKGWLRFPWAPTVHFCPQNYICAKHGDVQLSHHYGWVAFPMEASNLTRNWINLIKDPQ